MSLLVSIIKSSDSATVAESSKSFGPQGGTIGRGNDNSWVLEDPERYLSGCHCQITNENGQYFITDLSTNGTFYNGSPNPIGKGAKQQLNEGDTFIIGDYEFSVKNDSTADEGFASDPFGQDSLATPFGGNDSFSSDFGSSDDPFAVPFISSNDSSLGGADVETDPLAALDKAQGRGSQLGVGNDFAKQDNLFGDANPVDPFASSPAFSDQADPMNQQISWPDSVPDDSLPASSAGQIPDDWDDDFNTSDDNFNTPDNFNSSNNFNTPNDFHVPPVAPPVVPVPPVSKPVQSIPLTRPPVIPEPAQAPALEEPAQVNTSQHADMSVESSQAISRENARIQAELDLLKKQINSQLNNPSPVVRDPNVTVDTSLIESLGLHNHNLSDDEIIKINHIAGDVIKEMIKGLMQVLGSRGAIKNEFRMHVTTIQPVENNPIKFSANVEDALENMFIKQGKAYKKPLEAVREGFDSVAEHQVAILAGIKTAFKGVIERFDPAILEERFAKQNKGGFIPGSQKAKNWDLFHQYYNDLVGDIDNSFHYLFGDDFVRSYEEQLQKMNISKKAKKSTEK